jgi:hypothetical protein
MGISLQFKNETGLDVASKVLDLIKEWFREDNGTVPSATEGKTS